MRCHIYFPDWLDDSGIAGKLEEFAILRVVEGAWEEEEDDDEVEEGGVGEDGWVLDEEDDSWAYCCSDK